MISNLIHSGFVSSVLLGFLAYLAQSSWQSPSKTPHFIFFILYGYLVVLCMLGLHTLASRLVCWLTTSC